MRRFLLFMMTVAAFALFAAGTAIAQGGGGGGDQGNACPPQVPGFPSEPPPGCGRGDGTCADGLDNDHDGRKDAADSECRDPNDGCENGAPGCDDGGGAPTCPPADGPVSGIVQQVSNGVRNGGGAPLADVVDTVNCEIVVGVLGL